MLCDELNRMENQIKDYEKSIHNLEDLIVIHTGKMRQCEAELDFYGADREKKIVTGYYKIRQEKEEDVESIKKWMRAYRRQMIQ